MGFLRFLLALSVVAAHCNSIFGIDFVGGKVAVQAFYIISGFYMSLILNEKYVGQNGAFGLFITNRFLRLFPVYWVVLISSVMVCMVVSFTIKGHSPNAFDWYFKVPPDPVALLFLILTNLAIFGQDVVMFMGINPDRGSLYFIPDFINSNPALFRYMFILQAWTLGIELCFYLVAPFILTRGMKPVLICIGLSFLTRMFIYYYLGFNNDPWTHRFFPNELIFFLFGYLSYRISLVMAAKKIPAFVNVMILSAITLFTVIYYKIIKGMTINQITVTELIYLFCIFASIPFLFTFFKKNRVDSLIGELSYPVYISHMLVASICLGTHISFLKPGAAIAVCTIAVSWLLNKYVADPVEKFRQRRLK